MKGVQIKGKSVTGDTAIERVIDIREKMAELRNEVTALRKDREELLSEYRDLRSARVVPTSRSRTEATADTETVRVYAGDLHGMRMDPKCVAAFLSDVRKLNPDEIILGGDMLECGGHLAKHQPIGYVALCDYTYQEDVRATNWFLDELQGAAPNASVEYLEGNHEHRVERWCVDEVMASHRDAAYLRELYGPATLLRLKDRGIRFYPQADVHEDGLTRGWIKRGKMYVAHNIGEGKNAASKAVDKAGYNVTYFHTHSFDSSPRVFQQVGLVMAFSPGCLCEMQPMWRHSDPTGWNQGYDIDFIARGGNFQRIHVPIWRGESLAGAMIERFRKV